MQAPLPGVINEDRFAGSVRRRQQGATKAGRAQVIKTECPLTDKNFSGIIVPRAGRLWTSAGYPVLKDE
jgi:hypothetical protein